MSTMMLKSITPFPIFAPLAPPSTFATPSNSGHSMTEVRFSRWNNANAEEFNRQRRTQQQIEDDIRRHRRFQSAENIVNIFDSDNPSAPSTSTRTNKVGWKSIYMDQIPSFRSIGTPSTPSSPSIPGKKSKYSKPLNYNPAPSPTSKINHHPAFRKPKTKPIPQKGNLEQDSSPTETVKISNDGVSYVVPEAPFEYMYSYTETPKVKPLALREPPVTPFGPGTIPRPWTGRKPLPPSKKKLPEFDSFVAPPNKKGVKPVQKPGPFLPGAGPKYVWTREEILGDPLTQDEVKEMVESCRKTKRQLNLGRDGFTHNMLENIHAHWKRRRVCKIKCKGVCTVDMDNVCQQLEEKTGGKIIYRKGGVLYLFRGRNYNSKTRPRYPLMLWKPITPVYPRLVQQVPDGLTWDEANEMRSKGRQLVPICSLAKNGVYDKLVGHVKEAFEACELVRIDCQGLNGSDYRKIGAKLKDLVPCVLISFENEHILVWRGRDWKSSLLPPQDSGRNNNATTFRSDGFIDLSSDADQTVVASSSSGDQQEAMSSSCSEEAVGMLGTNDETSVLSSLDLVSVKNLNASENDSIEGGAITSPVNSTYQPSSEEIGERSPVNSTYQPSSEEIGERSPVMNTSINSNSSSVHGNETISDSGQLEKEEDDNDKLEISECGQDVTEIPECEQDDVTEIPECGQDVFTEISSAVENSSDVSTSSPYFQQVESLLRQAVESGTALILDDSVQDADAVYKKSAAFARHAPLLPEYRRKQRKVAVQKTEGQEVNGGQHEEEFVPALDTQVKGGTRTKAQKKKGFPKDYGGAAPQGSLGVDELAKLLA